MYIVLLGAPGSGKGTAAKILAEDLNIAHISTGQIFRDHMKNNTELGKKIHKYMDNGVLVPDEITIEMLIDRLNEPDVEKGAILDGFPRNIAQAIKLDEILEKRNSKVGIALNIDVPFDEIMKRIVNRRNCMECNEIYNTVFSPSKVEGICDKCGGKLYQREDQKPEIVQNRLDVYNKTAEKIIEHYEKIGVLCTKKAGIKEGKTSYDIAKEVEEMLKIRK